LTLICAAFAGWLTHIGYFGGAVFFEVPAVNNPQRSFNRNQTPNPQTHRIAAVLLSGDMGFRIGMGPHIADRLAQDGMPVLGVSSLTYFRQERSPAEVEQLVADAAQRALVFGHADRLVLIGQSFGADMLHVGIDALPRDLRQKVVLVTLVVPEDSVIFRASPSELFNWTTPDVEALPTAKHLTWAPVLCVSGREETESLCPLLHMPNVRWVALPGGHPLHRDVDALYATIRAGILRALAQHHDH
jgi:type IV secretory pathway VirJ component